MIIDLKIEIRRNSDNAIAVNILKNWNWNVYWWEEGNASCDCNREIFFLNAIGKEVPEETECGHGKYSVRCSNNKTGEILYNEI